MGEPRFLRIFNFQTLINIGFPGFIRIKRDADTISWFQTLGRKILSPLGITYDFRTFCGLNCNGIGRGSYDRTGNRGSDMTASGNTGIVAAHARNGDALQCGSVPFSLIEKIDIGAGGRSSCQISLNSRQTK